MTLITALQNPAAYPHPVSAIEVIETHISWVLLTGDYAYKIKKNICFDFLDFSTVEKRHFYCQEELRLNRRLAADLYLQVVTITGTEDQAQINGDGNILDYAVQMRQFPSTQLLNVMADHHALSANSIDQLADVIANFHLKIESADFASDYGSVELIQQACIGNFNLIRPLLDDKTLLSQLAQLEHWSELELSKQATLIQQRKTNGFIRECHGDLHLGNLALLNHQVTPFDGIEFNPSLCWIDVSNEIAFLMMDLQHRDLPQFAYRFLNRYLSQTGDYQALHLLRYYTVYRALVRAKVALLCWQQHQQRDYFDQYKDYAALAQSFTTAKPVTLIITHGYSGSGKSTLSAELAEKHGMIQLRADVERQRLFAEKNFSEQSVEQGIYSAEKSAQTYQKLTELAACVLEAGYSVIVDATFLQQSQRQVFQQLAQQKKVAFQILDFQVPETELAQRIQHRQQLGNDVSQATLAVLEWQLKTAQALTAEEQKQVIDLNS